MNEALRQHLPVIIAATVIGIATSSLALSAIYNAQNVLSADFFSLIIFVVPCVVMLICSFLIALTAQVINRNLYITVVAICLACGVLSMIITSGWLSNPDVAQNLLANSSSDTVIVPFLRSPLLILRNMAAYVVIPTIGCIAGAWLGSRLHPMRAEKTSNKQKRKK